MSDGEKKVYRSPGKLLISGEYFVLDGALALAVPTRLGQRMSVRAQADRPGTLHWRSFDDEDGCWFEARYALPDLEVIQTTDAAVGQRLQSVFKAISVRQPEFWRSQPALQITTRLEFPRLWGLGTSSTLLVNLAQWSQTDPFYLLRETFTGSGYDIACGLARRPILYQIQEGARPQFVQLPYRPPFAGQLYFVYLEIKQDSRAGIARYREHVRQPAGWADRLSAVALGMIQARDLKEFENCMSEHEQLIAQTLQLEPVQRRHFPDYWGQIKSLGAWGGDFIMAASDRSPQETRKYFNEKGFSVVLPYDELLV